MYRDDGWKRMREISKGTEGEERRQLTREFLKRDKEKGRKEEIDILAARVTDLSNFLENFKLRAQFYIFTRLGCLSPEAYLAYEVT